MVKMFKEDLSNSPVRTELRGRVLLARSPTQQPRCQMTKAWPRVPGVGTAAKGGNKEIKLLELGGGRRQCPRSTLRF